jgi:hypothetical protein
VFSIKLVILKVYIKQLGDYMSKLLITKDMVNLEKFDRFDGDDLRSNGNYNANSMWFREELIIDDEEVELIVSVYTEYISNDDVQDMIRDGADNAKKIYDKVAFINQKWEVSLSQGDVEISAEAEELLNELHDGWQDNNKDYVIEDIERQIESFKSKEQELQED